MSVFFTVIRRQQCGDGAAQLADLALQPEDLHVQLGQVPAQLVRQRVIRRHGQSGQQAGSISRPGTLRNTVVPTAARARIASRMRRQSVMPPV